MNDILYLNPNPYFVSIRAEVEFIFMSETGTARTASTAVLALGGLLQVHVIIGHPEC